MVPIYLDANATTPLLPAVAEAMAPYWSAAGNPASAHAGGRQARRALEDAREQVASLLGAHPDEVIFTSGATEANNLAVFGLAGSPPGRVVASPIEHPSVAEPLRQLATAGFDVAYLPISADGVVPADALAGIGTDVRLISVMLVNHETGAIQPVRQLAHDAGPALSFHCDATQAVGKLPVNFRELAVTSLALSAHKFHGPVGIGALLLRRGTKLAPRTWGGHQQQGRRPGTEPVALVVGLATALQLAVQHRGERLAHVLHLRQRFLEALQAQAAPIVVNGPAEVPTRASPYAVNVSFPGCRADALLMNLDLAGIACSTGSACSSGSLLPSPVLQAMGVSPEVLQSAMRFSFSSLLSLEEVEEAARRIAAAVIRLRRGEGERGV